MINMSINSYGLHAIRYSFFHQAAMEIIDIEEVRILDFPVGRHRSVSQALPRKRKAKKSKRWYVFILHFLVTKNKSLWEST